MTMPPIIRIFFAVDLPDPLRKKVEDVINHLRKTAKSNGIRWSKPENLHITLQFLAEIKSEHLPKLMENVNNHLAQSLNRIPFRLGSLHLFPNPYRPRVIVLEVLQQDHLLKLSQVLGEAIQATGYAIEERPFRAHLTLGRIKQPQGMSLSFISDCPLPDFEPIQLEEVVLFRSEPQPDGSKYTVLERIALT